MVIKEAVKYISEMQSYAIRNYCKMTGFYLDSLSNDSDYEIYIVGNYTYQFIFNDMHMLISCTKASVDKTKSNIKIIFVSTFD